LSYGAVDRIEPVMAQESPQDETALRCSFCHKTESEVAKLIANPQRDAFICSECIEACHFILGGESKFTHPTSKLE